MAVRKPIIRFSQLFLPGTISRSIWFVIGEKEEPRSPAEDPPLQNAIARKTFQQAIGNK
jgi:hypothetical protein